MPADASAHLQSDSRFDQDQVLVQSRQHFCGRGDAVDPGLRPSGAGKGCLVSLEHVDRGQSLFPQKCL